LVPFGAIVGEWRVIGKAASVARETRVENSNKKRACGAVDARLHLLQIRIFSVRKQSS
jgi:hypothetical protein